MDLISSLNRAFAERGLLSDALLYVDDGAAEAIHTNVGLKNLAGAILTLDLIWRSARFIVAQFASIVPIVTKNWAECQSS